MTKVVIKLRRQFTTDAEKMKKELAILKELKENGKMKKSINKVYAEIK